MSNEIRAAVITGIFAIIASAAGGVLGFIGGKSEYVEISKLHAAELRRQHNLLFNQFALREKELLLDAWRAQANQLHATRQALHEAFDPNLQSLDGLKGLVDAIVSAEKNFNTAGFVGFLTDNASNNERQHFVNLMNEKSVALAELQKITVEAVASEEQKERLDKEARTQGIMVALNRESTASAAFLGFFTSATLKSISREKSQHSHKL